MTQQENPTPTDSPSKKGLFHRLLTRFVQNDVKNCDELVEVIRDSEQNELIDTETREMIEGVMAITTLRVRDIMIPRTKIAFVDAGWELNDCLNMLSDIPHSRFPVISEDGNRILGILHTKDLLHLLHIGKSRFDLHAMLRPAILVPETKRLDRMLKDFREKHFHMAMVVDEFGIISGLITIEDILEQIVGEIEDEFDETDTVA